MKKKIELARASIILGAIVSLAACAAVAALVLLAGEHAAAVALFSSPFVFGPLAFGMAAAAETATVVDHPMQHMRPHWRFVGTINGTDFGSAAKSIRLLKTGYAGMLLLRVYGSNTIAVGGSTLLAKAPYFSLKDIHIQPPGGQRPHDADGWNTKMLNFKDRDFAPFITGAQAGNHTPTYVNGITRNAQSDESFPNVAGQANAFQLWYVTPFHRSAYDLRGILPAEKYDIDLWVTPAAVADIFTTPANITAHSLSVDVFQQVFDPPPADPTVGAVDTNWIFAHEQFSNQFGAPAVGDNKVELTSKGIYLDLIITLVLNALLDTTDVDQVGFRIGDNQWDTEKIDRKLWDFLQRNTTREDQPTGVIMWNFDRFVDVDGAAAKFNAHFELAMGEWFILDEDVPKAQFITHISGGVAGTTEYKAVSRRLLYTGPVAPGK